MPRKNEGCINGGVTTNELLRLGIPTLADVVASLSPTDCEAHVRALLVRLDGPSYEEYVKSLVDVALTGTQCCDDYYFAVRKYFPHIPRDNDALARLCILAMKMIVDRLIAGKEHIEKICDDVLDKMSGQGRMSLNEPDEPANEP